jgi:acyl-coenzyme A thioesterase PaaI-like protein
MRSSRPAAEPPPPPPGFAPLAGGSPFTDLVGPFWEKREGGRLWRGIRIEARHCNRLGITHGGLVLTFADTLLGAGMRHGLGSPRPGVTVKLSTDLMSAARVGDWLEGEAEVTRAEGGLVFVRGRGYVGRRTVFTSEGVFQLLAARKRVD